MTASSYFIDFTDLSVDPTNKQPITILPGELNTSTSIKLPGTGFTPYGEFILEDLLHIMENFASSTAPVNPTIGQLWYDTSKYRLKILRSTSSGIATWEPVANGVVHSPTQPAETDQLWYDTSNGETNRHTLKIYNAASSSWQSVVPGSLVVSASAPTNTLSLWLNTSNADAAKHEVYAYNPTLSAWRPAVSHDAAMLTGTVPDARLTTSSIGGNAATSTLAAAATKLATGRTIALDGGATGSTSFDGSANATITVTALNASTLSAGTVAVDRLGAAGTRAAGFYLAGNNVWTQMPYIPDAYTKPQTDALVNQRVLRDSITYAGFASGNTALPYFRNEADNSVHYLQTRLGYTPAPMSTTLAGYGITDAYTKAQVDALIPPAQSFPGVFGTTGWMAMPNGLLFEWGVGPGLYDDQSATVTLPRPGTILNVQVTAYGSINNSIGPCMVTDSWTNTSFRVGNNYGTAYYAFRWFAIVAM